MSEWPNFFREVQEVEAKSEVSAVLTDLAARFNAGRVLVITGSQVNNDDMYHYCNKHQWCPPNNTYVHKLYAECHCEMPSLCHTFTCTLRKNCMINHVVNENQDGLYQRSGIPDAKLSDVRGCPYIEQCSKCKDMYKKSMKVSCTTSHATNRTCTTCHGGLYDTLVDENDVGKLEFPHNWKVLKTKLKMARCIVVFGSSCEYFIRQRQLTPFFRANTPIYLVYKGEHILDNNNTLNVTKIEEDCDIVCHILAKRIGLPIGAPVKPYCCFCDPIIVKNPNRDESKFALCKCNNDASMEMMRRYLPFRVMAPQDVELRAKRNRKRRFLYNKKKSAIRKKKYNQVSTLPEPAVVAQQANFSPSISPKSEILFSELSYD
uniref:Deacetylase sirtuin-type domain-containing protein n=1 Tax=Panagrellus redivivus TaxID=6233 RepID=A0A7E4VAA4_PANRE